MTIYSRLKNRLFYTFRRYIKREKFLLEAARWFKDKGDETLRLSYPISSSSVVFDLGGYQGDFAAEMVRLYNCKVYVFEPVLDFYNRCVERFKDNPNVFCFNYGLSSTDQKLKIGLAENASSTSRTCLGGGYELIEVRDVSACIGDLGLSKIDLMKINIEGGEFDVLPRLIDTGLIEQIEFIQVQFHNFIEDAKPKRDKIRNLLANTHSESWCYEFIWESWARKDANC
ncbi:FkbM family methyltransferase [Pseudomonas otitidis]|uniref:FkbM family methyltransferase n=1 Tax=Metapseudomonas otitidis TaxID=319939 RepID=UPI0024492D61|nr:FkbM family methyltransferase [Pseudomonas otitidis]MDH1109309.1 FkbM family methyltransferase [Pseudomonas otitidis]MDH1157576.1 FkbM family methyltransferase [Pseudomonas otitidis]MDH1166318.1 FkbM family methyltransferase [Pseudomonas otitidis]